MRGLSDNTKCIVSLADGIRTSRDIADIVGLSPRYVRKVMARMGLPRRSEGAQIGERNHQFRGGRRIDCDGYAVVSAPEGHPYARKRKGSSSPGIILEHRLVVERKLGRFLHPQEVVDHIDGLTLHNDPSNLRLFGQNADHISVTCVGKPPKISERGRRNIGRRTDLGITIEPVDMHSIRRKRGDVRLRQILLAALRLGTDSPFLLGSSHHTKKAGIDLSSHSTITRALDDLYARWEWLHIP